VGVFKLQVIPLTEFYSVNQELGLEQYFLLHPEYLYITLVLHILLLDNIIMKERKEFIVTRPRYLFIK